MVASVRNNVLMLVPSFFNFFSTEVFNEKYIEHSSGEFISKRRIHLDIMLKVQENYAKEPRIYVLCPHANRSNLEATFSIDLIWNKTLQPNTEITMRPFFPRKEWRVSRWEVIPT